MLSLGKSVLNWIRSTGPHYNVLIVGTPKSGKTTLFQFVQEAASKRAFKLRSDEDSGRVGMNYIRVDPTMEVRDFGNLGTDLMKLAREYGAPPPTINVLIYVVTPQNLFEAKILDNTLQSLKSEEPIWTGVTMVNKLDAHPDPIYALQEFVRRCSPESSILCGSMLLTGNLSTHEQQQKWRILRNGIVGPTDCRVGFLNGPPFVVGQPIFNPLTM